MNRALIIGSRGQDGQLLTDLLRSEGRAVFGLGRGDCNLTDPGEAGAMLDRIRPDEIYYLAAFHHSAEEKAECTELELFRRSHETHVDGIFCLLSVLAGRFPETRVFYAASSHVFGSVESDSCFQDENTPFDPQNLYGITKAAGTHVCRHFRRQFGIHASVGFLYNHESRYRRNDFLSRKVVRGAIAIKRGQAQSLLLGDLDAKADWGFAPDYVDAMRRIVALPEPDEFIVATGKLHTVREFAEIAFGALDLDWSAHVRANPGVLIKKRSILCGNSAKLRIRTGWKPTVTFREMVEFLVEQEMNGRGASVA